MESFFPDIFFLSFFAPVLLRLPLAFVMLYDARHMWDAEQKNRASAIALLIMAVLIGIGLFTQLAAIIAATHMTYLSFKSEKSVFRNRLLLLLGLTILLSIFVTGPGGLAFDLPY
jgi:uncharacterized membrane protein YphA (DoxX/SURF4 family)